MTSHVDQLEQRLFRHYWDDGLLDLFAGLAVVGIGICWTFDLVALGAIVPVLLLPFWTPLRRALVEPRAGLVEFSDERDRKTRRLLRHSVWLGVIALAAFVVLYTRIRSNPGALLPLVAPAIPALLIGLASALAGLALGLPRFLWYAALLAACGLGVAITDSRPEGAMIAGGVLVCAGGAWLLARFLRLDVETGEAN